MQVNLKIRWNGELFGNANGREMNVGFHELIAHAATNRSLCAGTIIGSGTVANENYREVGSSCIMERRAIDMLDSREALTEYMSFDDAIHMESRDANDNVLFGAMNQRVVRAT